MYLKSFKFKRSDGLSFERIDFQPWNLFVGGSGTGKTRLLEAIRSVSSIVTKEVRWAPTCEWDCVFTDTKGVEFCWQGKTKTNEVNMVTMGEERLWRNKALVFHRNERELKINGDLSNNPPRADSMLYTSGAPEVLEAADAIRRLVFSEGNRATQMLFESIPEKEYYEGKCDSIEDLRNKPFSALIKLCLSTKYFSRSAEAEAVKDAFKECFPTVQDVEFAFRVQSGKDVYPFFRLKEDGDFVDYNRTSSGMIRALVHLAEIHFSPDGTLFLIDEVENSLGENCIDEVTSWLMERRRGCQYIMTSHHPKVINKVPMKYWQILSRKGGLVSSMTAEQAGLGKSRHTAFMQLMNMEGFAEGATR